LVTAEECRAVAILVPCPHPRYYGERSQRAASCMHGKSSRGRGITCRVNRVHANGWSGRSFVKRPLRGQGFWTLFLFGLRSGCSCRLSSSSTGEFFPLLRLGRSISSVILSRCGGHPVSPSPRLSVSPSLRLSVPSLDCQLSRGWLFSLSLLILHPSFGLAIGPTVYDEVATAEPFHSTWTHLGNVTWDLVFPSPA